MNARLAEFWPASGAIARSGNIELRWLDDELALDLAAIAVNGIHGPDERPFTTTWNIGTPLEIHRATLAWVWSQRGTLNTANPHILTCVLVDGKPAGTQGFVGKNWPVLREFETGSWLGREFQGHGIGTRMRELALTVGFEALGAEHMLSCAFLDNPASMRVSEKIGYQLDGIFREEFGAEVRTSQRFRLSREDWLADRERHDALLGAPAELSGFDALQAQLDAPPAPASN